VGRPPQELMRDGGRLPIGKASGPDHGLGDSSHTQSCQGRKVRKCGGQGGDLRRMQRWEQSSWVRGRIESEQVSSDHGE
jgi:hypothetical protein